MHEFCRTANNLNRLRFTTTITNVIHVKQCIFHFAFLPSTSNSSIDNNLQSKYEICVCLRRIRCTKLFFFFLFFLLFILLYSFGKVLMNVARRRLSWLSFALFGSRVRTGFTSCPHSRSLNLVFGVWCSTVQARW